MELESSGSHRLPGKLAVRRVSSQSVAIRKQARVSAFYFTGWKGSERKYRETLYYRPLISVVDVTDVSIVGFADNRVARSSVFRCESAH